MNKEYKLQKLDWDTNFFGIPVFRLNMHENIDMHMVNISLSEAPKGALVYVFDDSEKNKNELEKLGAKLYDVKVLFQRSNLSFKDIDQSEVEIVSVESTSDDLLELALQSGEYSRFKLDPLLEGKFQEMYEIWIRKSVDREIADIVLGAYRNEELLGFVTVKKQPDTSTIGLIAVGTKSRGLGIGSKLLTASEDWSIVNGLNCIDVATQLDNQLACSFYSKNGYQIIKKDWIYHYLA